MKQTPKQSHEEFDNIMLVNKSKMNEADKCVYVKTIDKSYVNLCLSMDDVVILGSDYDEVYNENIH